MSAGKTVALVTGANKGIGFAIVRALCKELGDNGVVYLAGRDEGRGQKAVQDLKGEGLNPKFIQLDICNNDHISKVASYMKDNHGGLDILVNNAAIDFLGYEPENASVTLMETNLFANLRLSQALIPLIRSHGRVVNMASMLSAWSYPKLGQDLQKRFRTVDTEQGVIDLMNEFLSAAQEDKKKERGWDIAGQTNYIVSKLGVISLTRVQGQDIMKDSSRKDILINCCCPGYVNTDMTNHLGPLTIDEGALTPVYLALLPKGTSHQGLFFTKKEVNDFW